MSKSSQDSKHLILIGILCISLAILARPYLTGHRSQSRPATARPVGGFEAVRTPAPAYLNNRSQEVDGERPQEDDDSLSEIERLLR